MEIIKSLMLYIVKNIYYSSLLVLPVIVLLGLFKKISSVYKYNICLAILLIIPLLPFIQVPRSLGNSINSTKIENISREVVNKPLTAITNFKADPVVKKNKIINSTTGIVVSTTSESLTNKTFASKIIDFRILGLYGIFVVYISLVLILVIQLISSAVSLRNKMSTSKVTTDADIIVMMRDVYEILNIKKIIRVVIVKGISSPFSVGIFKHYIVLPHSNNYSDQDLRQILLHEATHIKRNDCLITWFQRAIEILLFFNPAVWLISSSLTRNRELICDGQVVQCINDRESYAKVLLSTAVASIKGVPKFSNGAVGSKKDLSNRIDSIVNKKTEYKKLHKVILKISLLILFFSSVFLIGCTNRASNLYNVNSSETVKFSHDDIGKVVSLYYKTDNTNMPGCSILVSSNGNVIYKEAFGMANIEQGSITSDETTFKIASITKQFTSTAILLLKERGLLTLNDKLSKYIPDFPKGDDVTIYQLLTHTSGIKNYTEENDLEERAQNPISAVELINIIKTLGYDFEPGERFKYNNSGYFILGYIIELVSGQSYEDFLHNNIFEPLNMTHTGVYKKGLNLPNEAIGYSYVKGKMNEVLDWDMSNIGGAGNLYSNVNDLFLWNEAVFNGKILSKKSLAEAFSPVLLLNGENAIQHGFDYGLGWSLDHSLISESIEHSGSLHGFTSSISRLYDDNISIIILTNKTVFDSGADIGALGIRIRRSIYNNREQS